MSNDPIAAELPLSRLFSQFLRTWNYRPVTSWDHFFNPQFFINSNPGDVAVENDVLAQVGSYGQQLGTIIDALSVVAANVAKGDLLPADRRALDRLSELADGVNAVVARHRPSRARGLTTAEIDDFAGRLDRLRRDDPAAGQAATERLGQVAGNGAGTP
jgi:ABC-type transporter Mla subunit MlaD